MTFWGRIRAALGGVQAPPVRDPFEDQRVIVSKHPEPVIFDVGAHVGWTTHKYASLFPRGSIWAFEPYPVAFLALKLNTAGNDQVHLVNRALGIYTGETLLHCNVGDQTNSLLPTDPRASSTWECNVVETRGMQLVKVQKLDEFAAENQIKRIDILKLDTQGSEHLVLDGAKGLLGRGDIGVVYTEIITMPTYQNQAGLLGMLARLEGLGYDLHSLYNLWSTDGGRLRQLDALFVHRDYDAGIAKGLST